MALTHNKISIKNIIAKVYQDLDLSTEIDIGMLIEWSAEVLGKINVYQQLDTKYDKLKVCNYKVEIPCDLVYLNRVGYNGIQLSKVSGGDTYFPTAKPKYNMDPQSVNMNKLANEAFLYGMSYSFNKTNETFIMENGWFKTSFKEGELDIQYQSLPVDDEGFPLVPDDESYRDAIFWYIAHKYFYIKSISEDRFWRFYKDAEEKFRYYVNQAGANAMMPDIFTLENIKRNYLQLLPKVNSYDRFFSDLNKPSDRINSNAR